MLGAQTFLGIRCTSCSGIASPPYCYFLSIIYKRTRSPEFSAILSSPSPCIYFVACRREQRPTSRKRRGANSAANNPRQRSAECDNFFVFWRLCLYLDIAGRVLLSLQLAVHWACCGRLPEVLRALPGEVLRRVLMHARKVGRAFR